MDDVALQRYELRRVEEVEGHHLQQELPGQFAPSFEILLTKEFKK
jgi:hypothetical protein